jgi:hypothetical protein
MIDPIFFKVLRKICARLNEINVNWALTGSLNLALQGVSVEVNDIDILTDTVGAYEIENCISEFVTKKVAFSPGETIRSHLGALMIDGVKVEIMGDVQFKRENGSWEAPADLELSKKTLEIEGMQIPVMSLEHEYQAYVKLRDMKKLEILRKRLSGNSSST